MAASNLLPLFCFLLLHADCLARGVAVDSGSSLLLSSDSLSAFLPPHVLRHPQFPRFRQYVFEHQKVYSSVSEGVSRFRNFLESVEMVESHNKKKLTYELELNEFADWSWEEFHSKHLATAQVCSATEGKGNHVLSDRKLPPKRDWRLDGIVSKVKSQGGCGSCWTFSTTGALEAAMAQKTGKIVLLSEQQLVDCAGAFNNFGCQGGLPSQAFEYVKYNGGLDSESAYRYKGQNERCGFKPKKVAATVQDVVNITQYDEFELQDAVAFVRPVSIAFQVVKDFRLYRSGVYTSSDCGSTPESVNHAVLAVGFDMTGPLLPNWIVKNSWGKKWGDRGYFRIALGSNMCGVSTCASYPIV